MVHGGLQRQRGGAELETSNVARFHRYFGLAVKTLIRKFASTLSFANFRIRLPRGSRALRKPGATPRRKKKLNIQMRIKQTTRLHISPARRTRVLFSTCIFVCDIPPRWRSYIFSKYCERNKGCWQNCCWLLNFIMRCFRICVTNSDTEGGGVFFFIAVSIRI